MPSSKGKTRLRLALALVAAAWCAVYVWRVAWPAARATTNGFAAYYTAAYLLVHEPGGMDRIYDDDWFAAQIEQASIPSVYDIFNLQPPTMSLLLLPLVWLPPDIARTVWIALSLLLLPAGLALLARALALPARWGLWLTPLCPFYAPVYENLRNGQAYLFVFFLICLLFWALLWRRKWVGGLALGLMLALKSAGIWLWPLLLWERRWRTLVVGVLVAAALALASLPWIGLEAWLVYASNLPRLATMSARYVTAYQTATSLFGHLFVYDARWNPSPVADWPWLARGLSLGLLVGMLLLSARWGRLRDSRRDAQALTLALFAAPLVANSPVGEGHHYLMVLPSVIVAVWWAWRARPGWLVWAVLFLAILLIGAPLPYMSRRLQVGWLAVLAYPRVYGAFLLWGWLGWALQR